MSLWKPKLATYVEADSKGVDIVDLCRRIIGEYQYVDKKPAGELVSYEQKIPIVESNFLEVKNAMTTFSRMNPFWLETTTKELKKAILGKTYSRVTLRMSFGLNAPQITGKSFYTKGGLSKRQVERLYWTLRMRWSCSIINQTVSHLIPELKNRGHSGFNLPNGKTVSFESLHFAVLEIVPKEYTIFHYVGSNDPTSIEQLNKIDEDHGLIVQHIVLAFNLADANEHDHKQGGLFIVDPTGSQFQGWCPNSGLVSYGFWEDYEKSYPVDKIVITGFEPHYHIDPSYVRLGPPLLNKVKENLLLPACNFCGDVEKKNRKRSVDLKKCSGCKLVAYCDSTCQKLAWRSHKPCCRSSDN